MARDRDDVLVTTEQLRSQIAASKIFQQPFSAREALVRGMTPVENYQTHTGATSLREILMRMAEQKNDDSQGRFLFAQNLVDHKATELF